MIDKLRKRMNEEKGFTLIELLVVIIIIGILLAIAVPSYLGFKDKANAAAAKANVRAALPAAEAFYSDNGTYAGLANDPATGTPKGWLSYDAGLKAQTDSAQDTVNSYCIYSVVGGKAFFKLGPSNDIVEDTTPAATPCAS